MSLAPTSGDVYDVLIHQSVFFTLPILLAVVRCLPIVDSAKAIHIPTSTSILVPSAASIQNCGDL